MQNCHTYFFCWQLKNVVNRAESIIGICTVDDVPDARTIWKYREELTRFCTINTPARTLVLATASSPSRYMQHSALKPSKLKDYSFFQQPPAALIAQKERGKIPENPGLLYQGRF